MKLRKILAAVAASAVAVSALAISAFAADYPTGTVTYTKTMAAEDVMFAGDDGASLGQIQLGHVSQLDSFTATYASADGADTGFMNISTNWGGDAAVAADGVTVATGGWSGANITFPETVTDFAGYTITFLVSEDADAQKANWIDTLGYGEDAILDMQVVILALNGTGNTTIYASDYDVVADADANAGVQDGGAEMTGDKANSDTGVEGIAVVAGLAVVAAGAIVVAKKRK